MNDKISQKDFNTGGNFTQNIGSNVFNAEGELNDSQIYDCLECFEGNSNKEMDISVPPAGLNKKLSFNHAGKYILLFQNYYRDIENMEKVISNDYPTGDNIVSTLIDIFYDSVPDDKYDDEGNITINNGSKVLDKMRTKIVNRIIHDPRFKSKSKKIEIAEKFAIAFIGYGVRTCQVLLNPEKVDSNDSNK